MTVILFFLNINKNTGRQCQDSSLPSLQEKPSLMPKAKEKLGSWRLVDEHFQVGTPSFPVGWKMTVTSYRITMNYLVTDIWK